MSRETALGKARQLKQVLLQHGVPEVSIELMQGRPLPDGGDRWDSLRIVANFAHHIGSEFGPNLTPGLAGVKRGRPAEPGLEAIPGPLANGYGGWDLCYRIITFGYANHPGKGGPLEVNGFRIPKDSARPYTWGTEWEGGLAAADWDRTLRNPRTGDRMTMREFMGRAHAAIQSHFGLPRDAHLEHKTWAPGRKPDRLGYTRDSGIDEIRRFSDRQDEGDDVKPDDVVGFETDPETGKKVPITMEAFVGRMNWLYRQVLENGKVDAQLDRIETKVSRPQ